MTMEDQAKIVRLTVAILGACVGIVLIGLVIIAVRYDGDTAKDIVGTFTNIAVTTVLALGGIISTYVAFHRPTAATTAAAPSAPSTSTTTPEASDAASG